jgi:hypothetical protein
MLPETGKKNDYMLFFRYISLCTFLMLGATGTLAQQIGTCGTQTRISFSTGSSSLITLCNSDQLPSVLAFKSSSPSLPYVILVTDEAGVIQLISYRLSIDFDTLPRGKFRVYVLSFLGNLLAKPGMNAFTQALGKQCYGLSANFITISSLSPHAGTLAFAGGGDKRATCPGDGNPDLLRFVPGSNDAQNYYLITDEQDVILDVVNQPEYNFEGSEKPRRIWSVSSSKPLQQIIGQRIQDANLNTECSDLSDNFLLAYPARPDGGRISFPGGLQKIRQCIGDTRNNPLTLSTSSSSVAQYTYLLTQASDNRFIRSIPSASLDISTLPSGQYRLWGLSFSGVLRTNPALSILEYPLSDNCYALSTNFLEIELFSVVPGDIKTQNGRSDTLLCLHDNLPDRLSFLTNPFPGYASSLVVCDENDIALGIFPSNSLIDFAQIPGKVNLVYGVSYESELNLKPGESIRKASATVPCLAFTNAPVRVVKENPNAGQVSSASGKTREDICFVRGKNPGSIRATASGNGNLRFILTDDEEGILLVSENGVFDFAPFPDGTYRIYALSFTGSFSAPVGASIRNVPSFASGCADLSDNFVQVDKYILDGARVALQEGGNARSICSDGSSGNILPMVNTSKTIQAYAYLLTDTTNRVVRIFRDDKVALDKSDAGTFRIWGVAYSGSLTTAVGSQLETTAHGSICYSLSENYVAVTRGIAAAGSIATSTGGTSFSGCIDPGGASVLTLAPASTPGKYAYILTDTLNRILVVSDSASFSFEGYQPGKLRAWRIAYSGTLLVQPGQTLQGAVLASGCYDLSGNFIRVELERTDGGNLRLPNGTSSFSLCLGQGSGFISFLNSSAASLLPYRYVLTNDKDEVVLVLSGSSFDISIMPMGGYRVYGVSFTGTLNLRPGMNIRSANISDRCYDLSDNYISLFNELVRGGFVVYADGSREERYICPQEQGSKALRFQRIGSQSEKYAILAVNNSGIVVAVGGPDSISLQGVPEGSYQIWGLAYSGTLNAKPGFNPARAPMAERCYSLSSNALTLNWTSPLAATVSLSNGATREFFCPGGSPSQKISLQASDALGGTTTFLLADSTGRILQIADSAVFYLDSMPTGLYQVRALTYNGTLLAKPGLPLDTVLATTCYTLSTNAVRIYKEKPKAGSIQPVLTGSENGLLCSGGIGSANKRLVIRSSQAGRTPYIFLATDTLNRLVYSFPEGAVPDTATYREINIPLDSLRGGQYRFWGLAYTGTLRLSLGTRIDNSALSTDCFELSAPAPFGFQSVDGGTVRAEGFEGGPIYVCIGDNRPDSISFSNSSTGVGSGYRYILTNSSNLVLAELTGNVQNFENAGFRELRIWGLSFTGTYTSIRNRNLLTAVPSNGCYELSNNYVTIIREAPASSTVQIAGSTADLSFCPGRDGAAVQVSTVTSPRAGYVYLLSDRFGVLLEISRTGLFNLKSRPMGTYRVQGLSYTGNLLVKAGDTLQAGRVLASSCHQLSGNSIQITRGAEVEGGALSTIFGETTVATCPGDKVFDLVIVNLPKPGPESEYRLLITNAQNRIIYPNVQNPLIDFEDIGPGVYRIWGVSYAGNFLGQFNDTIGVDRMSTGCFDLSDPYITVIAEEPKGGAVFVGDSLNSITINRADTKVDIYRIGRANAAPNAPYAYLLTSVSDEIISVQLKDSINLDALPVGNYRMWGLSYTGTLLAAPGAVAGVSPMSDNCNALSSNFVGIQVRSSTQVRPDLPETSNEPPAPRDAYRERAAPWSLRIAPNPVQDRTRAIFSLPGAENERVRVEILALNGALVETSQILAVPGINEFEVDLNAQKPGAYLLRISGKVFTQSVRLIKL